MITICCVLIFETDFTKSLHHQYTKKSSILCFQLKLKEIAYCRLEPYVFSACSQKCRSCRTADRQSQQGNEHPQCGGSCCATPFRNKGIRECGRRSSWTRRSTRQRVMLPALSARLALRLHRHHHRVLRRCHRRRIRSRASLKD